MKQMLVIFTILLLLFFAFQCGEKKPTDSDQEDPNNYFPISFNYKWTYAVLGNRCVATGDTFVITAVDRNTRSGLGAGWDLVSSASGGTSFVYRLADTIFYKKNVKDDLPPYKILVGPIRVGTYWKDRPPYDFEYNIVGFEDFHSSVAGQTYQGCAKIKRIAQGETKIKYFWWAPQMGKAKEANYQSGECLGGEELKRRDIPWQPP